MAKKKNLNIKKGDVVRVIAGKDKGAEGKVIAVAAEQDRVIVEGVNRVKRHTKVVNQGGRAGTTGGIITQEAAIHVSNVMLLVDARAATQGQGDHPRRLQARRGRRSAGPTARRTPRSAASRVARKTGEEI